MDISKDPRDTSAPRPLVGRLKVIPLLSLYKPICSNDNKSIITKYEGPVEADFRLYILLQFWTLNQTDGVLMFRSCCMKRAGYQSLIMVNQSYPSTLVKE